MPKVRNSNFHLKNKLVVASVVSICFTALATQFRGQAVPDPAAMPNAHPASTASSASTTSFGQVAVPEIFPGFLAGYLKHAALPNSLALVQPSPVKGSAAQMSDKASSQSSLALRGSPRWELAKMDADLTFPHAAGTFSCAANIPITETDTPHLFVLLRRSLTDAALSTYSAKNYYKRPRPFAENKQPTCTPDEEQTLRKDGSYPSGHTTIGWTWALILTEVAPDQADAILARGLEFGESRIVCNVHWRSDVDAGRIMAASTVAKLHADAAFKADLEAAKTEYAVAVAKGLKPTRDCAQEAAVLKAAPKPALH